jgi:hypothetical protein
MFLATSFAEDPAVTTIVTPGGDDVSYQIPLTVSVVFDGVTYENVYATTNSVITFGRPDGTYWDYPVTPSISVESRDWWVLPQQMPDTHFIISVSEGGFQVDGKYRPYGVLTGDTTCIIVTGQIQTDGSVSYTYNVDGPLQGNERTGARLTDGTVVPLEQANIIEVIVPPVLEPEPVAPTPEPTPTPTSTPEPQSTVEPTPEPSPTPTPTTSPEPILPPLPEPPQPRPPIVIEILPPVVEEPPVEEPQPPIEEEQPPAIEPEPPIEEELPPAVEPEPTPVPEEAPPVEEEAPLTVEEIISVVEDLVADGNLTAADAETVLDALMADGEITSSEVNSLSESLSSDGEFTSAEKELVADALIESADGEAVTSEAIAEAGLDYADLPPATPVEVRQDENGNEVIISAVVADALELLESPAEMLSAVFENPAQLIFALGNLGADMSEEEREEATKTVVAATIVGNIAATAVAASAVGTAGYRRNP